MAIGAYVLAILFLSLVLVGSTRLAVSSFDRLTKKLGIASLALSGILVALSTSLPELFVGIFAGLEGKPQVSVGNVLGSNIVNLSLVMGLATIISGSLGIIGDYFAWEFGVSFLMGAAPLILLFDGRLSRFDGLILLLIYIIYVRDLVVAGKHKEMAKRGGASHFSILQRVKRVRRVHVDKTVIKLLLGIAALVISADLIVRFSSVLANAIGLPLLLVSLILVALGTSLPELALEIEAVRKRSIVLALGNILGSTVTNSTLIIGVTALISPFSVAAFDTFGFAGITFVVVFSLFWLFTKTKKKLERWEALVLLGIYLMFLGVELFVS